MMKIVTTMEENRPVKVQRFEGDLEVGCRQVSVADYCNSLISQLPLGTHFEYMIKNRNEYKDHFDTLKNPKQFASFVAEIINSAPLHWIKDNEVVLQLVNAALHRIDFVSSDTPELTSFIKNVTTGMSKVELDTNMYEVLKHLIVTVFQNNSDEVKEDLRNVIHHYLMILLNNEQREETMHLIESIIPYLDNDWFSKMVIESQKRTKQKVSYYSGPVPKDISYLSVNSRGTTYVYDVPAKLIDITYQGENLGKIGHPRMLFLYQLNEGGTVKSMKLYAAKSGEQLQDGMTVYEYPYSHVFRNGSVCWRYDDITVEMLPYASELFLSGNNSTHGRKNVLGIYLEHKELPFDENKLKPIALFKDVL